MLTEKGYLADERSCSIANSTIDLVTKRLLTSYSSAMYFSVSSRDISPRLNADTTIPNEPTGTIWNCLAAERTAISSVRIMDMPLFRQTNRHSCSPT